MRNFLINWFSDSENKNDHSCKKSEENKIKRHNIKQEFLTPEKDESVSQKKLGSDGERRFDEFENNRKSRQGNTFYRNKSVDKYKRQHKRKQSGSEDESRRKRQKSEHKRHKSASREYSKERIRRH